MLQIEMSDEALNFKEFYSLIDKFHRPMQTILRTIKYRHQETSGTLVLGHPGCGKSFFAEKILKDYAEKSMPDKDRCFGIYVETSGCGLNELYREILTKLGDIDPGYGRIADKHRRIIHLVNKLDVKVVFLDEIQVMLPTSGLLPTSKFVKQLKEMVNKTNCAWVLLGVPDAADIVAVDTQLADRFPRVVCLESFSCAGENKVLDFMEYLFDLLANFPRKMPYFKCLNESINDDGYSYKSEVNYDNLLRLCLASQGRPRRIRDLFVDCIENTSSDEKVTKATFESAYVNCYSNNTDKQLGNPFLMPIKEVKKCLIKDGLYA